MTSPFFACSPSVWPRYVAGVLDVSTDPWENDDVISDLRWHVDQRKKLPGRSKLMARWRWPDWAVRKMLVNTALWWDPTKGEAPTSRDDLGKSRLRAPSQRHQDPSRRLQDPSRGQPEDDETTPSMDENPPHALPAPPDALLPPPHGLLTVSTRATTSPAPSPDTTTLTGTHEQGASPLDPIHLGPCQICGHIVAAGCRHGITGSLFDRRPSEAAQTPQATTDLALVPPKPSRAKPAPAKGIADPEVARVWEAYRVHHPARLKAGKVDAPTKGWGVEESVEKYGADAMISVIQWAHTSEDSAAQFLRDTGNTGETLFRPKKRERYVELSAQWEARGRLAAPMTPGRQLSPREETNNDVEQWLANNRKPQRDVIEAEEPKWIR